MKRNFLSALGALTVSALLLTSCNGGASVPKASLSNSTDSLSYAYGVNLADQGGLIQFLEQSGVLQNTDDLEYQLQMLNVDSTSSPELQKQKEAIQSKIDSIKKVNAPKLNEFIKGVKQSLSGSEEKTPYILGLSIGNQIKTGMLPQFNEMAFAADTTQKVNENQMLSGLIGALKGEELAFNKMDANQYMQTKMEAAQAEAMKKQEEALKVQYKDSIAAGDKFLAENAKREGVVTLPSGLQYEIIKEGRGPVPTEANTVKVNYKGTLINGTVFDSSYDRKEPTTFGVTQVIPGWTEALKLMPVGSKWKVYIPYNLAYGGQDRGTIPPFSNLIFEVELLEIVNQ